MTRFGWMVLGCAALIALLTGLVAWLYLGHPQAPVSTELEPAPTVDPSELSIYTSGEYGFSFFYPSLAVVTDAYSLGSTTDESPWRSHAVGTGTPVVRISKGAEEMRVGVSTDSKELEECLKPAPGEDSRGSFAVGSTTWQEFMFQKLGTDQEQQVTSYRVERGGSCYAVEVFEPLEGATGASGYTMHDSITSFTFAK
jgi:hypothetical protein